MSNSLLNPCINAQQIGELLVEAYMSKKIVTADHKYFMFTLARDAVGMSLVVRNLQRSVPFSTRILKYHVSVLIKLFGVDVYDLGVLCVGKLRMQKLNKVYRDVDVPTDVLSFPYLNQTVTPGKLPEPDLIDCHYNLGDIFLCLPFINEQCLQERKDLQSLLPVFVTHGICHLLGYTHNTKNNWEKMFSKEKEILSSFSQVTGIKNMPLTDYSEEEFD